MISILLISYLFTFSLLLNAQSTPIEGSKLNYRLIGISFSAKQGANKYKIDIASGDYNSEINFNDNIIQRIYCTKNKVIAEVPSFGSKYTWRVTCYIGKKTISENIFHHFSTLPLLQADLDISRLRILEDNGMHSDAYVFLDGNRALYDMKGNEIWFLPENDDMQPLNSPLRDLKLFPKGTLLF